MGEQSITHYYRKYLASLGFDYDESADRVIIKRLIRFLDNAYKLGKIQGYKDGLKHQNRAGGTDVPLEVEPGNDPKNLVRGWYD
jgi:hypothetical protein